MFESLLAAIEAQIPAEIIDGCNVNDAAKMVMLEVEFTPVIWGAVSEELMGRECPDVQRVEQRGERYLMLLPGNDFEWVDAESLKRMRARYILCRGWYWRRLKSLSYPMQQKVLRAFFPDGTWQPREGSELSRAMGLEPEATR